MKGTPTAVNPDNDRPTVRLFAQDGTLLHLVSQREAGRLLRAGQAELVLDVPPGVRLCDGGPDEPAERGLFLHARKGILYGDIVFQSPAGEEMFHGDAEKALWYLNRGLVEVVGLEPPILRFRFTPEGAGHAGDAFYLGTKANRCVVCGAEEGLNRHHVVPSVYRRHLPKSMKEHSHHDVVLLCLACHERYEREADALKAELGRECGVPPHGLRAEPDRRRSRAIVFARTLINEGDRIPSARREEMLQVIAVWFGNQTLTEVDVEAISRLDPGPAEAGIEHGREVVASTDVRALVRRWREHFLRVMQPRFMPEHWDVERMDGISSGE